MDFKRVSGRQTVILMMALPLALTGCLMEDKIDTDTSTTADSGVNSAPTISGVPSRNIRIGVDYNFTPAASDTDADPLSFNVTNRPGWANFDTNTGKLSGIPSGGTEGTYNGIVISASDGQTTTSLPAFSITVLQSTAGNSPPEINGSAASSVLAGNNYSFTPSATDPDGDSLTFSIRNRPSWSTFNTASGQLSGSPQEGDIGIYSGISISVNDGELTASLNSFAINVDQVSTGSVTLNWSPPTENTDGSALTDLAGYRIYYGPAAGNYPNSIIVDNPGLSVYLVDNLVPGTYFFVSTAMNSQGIESSYSNVAEKTIN